MGVGERPGLSAQEAEHADAEDVVIQAGMLGRHAQSPLQGQGVDGERDGQETDEVAELHRRRELSAPHASQGHGAQLRQILAIGVALVYL